MHLLVLVLAPVRRAATQPYLCVLSVVCLHLALCALSDEVLCILGVCGDGDLAAAVVAHGEGPYLGGEVIPDLGGSTHRHILTLYTHSAIKGRCSEIRPVEGVGKTQEDALQAHSHLPTARYTLSEAAARWQHIHPRQPHLLIDPATFLQGTVCPLCVLRTCFFSALKRTPLAMCSPHVLHQMLNGTSNLQAAKGMHVSLLAYPVCRDCTAGCGTSVQGCRSSNQSMGSRC